MEDNVDFLLEKAKRRNFETFKSVLMDSAIYGTIIVIDLTDSAKLKVQKHFPNWIEIINHFYTVVTDVFSESKISPIKFLGDAIFFFHPDEAHENSKKYRDNREFKFAEGVNYNKLLELCKRVKINWWNEYKKYLTNQETKDNYLELTVAVDYGLVIDFNIFQEGDSPDPLGVAVDRCFRISKAAGPNQILLSKQFYDKMIIEMKSKDEIKRDEIKRIEENEIIRISISDNFLKGCQAQGYLYFVLPEEDEIDWIISEKNRKLIEENISKPMIYKVKIKLLRRKINLLNQKVTVIQKSEKKDIRNLIYRKKVNRIICSQRRLK